MSGTRPTCLEMAPLPEHCHSFMAHGGGTPPLTCPRLPCPAQLRPVLVDCDPNRAESWRWSHTVHAEPLAAGMGADRLLESQRGKGTRPRSHSSGGWSWRPQGALPAPLQGALHPQVFLEMLQEADSPAEVANRKTEETEEGLTLQLPQVAFLQLLKPMTGAYFPTALESRRLKPRCRQDGLPL